MIKLPICENLNKVKSRLIQNIKSIIQSKPVNVSDTKNKIVVTGKHNYLRPIYDSAIDMLLSYGLQSSQKPGEPRILFGNFMGYNTKISFSIDRSDPTVFSLVIDVLVEE